MTAQTVAKQRDGLTRQGRRIGRASGPAVIAAALLCLGGSTARAQSCVGDCNGNGSVSIDELIRGVSLALGLPAAPCAAIDEDGDDLVSVNELVAGVNGALCGCGHICPTPLPTRTFTVTATARPTSTATATPPPDTPTREFTPTRTPTLRPGSCVRVKQGLWCLFVGDVLGIEDRLTQAGCVLTFADQSLRGPISGDCWTVDNRQFDVRLTCCFSGGNPATQCEGSADVQGTVVDVQGAAGPCEGDEEPALERERW